VATRFPGQVDCVAVGLCRSHEAPRLREWSMAVLRTGN
jgi:hypothetical protein